MSTFSSHHLFFLNSLWYWGFCCPWTGKDCWTFTLPHRQKFDKIHHSQNKILSHSKILTWCFNVFKLLVILIYLESSLTFKKLYLKHQDLYSISSGKSKHPCDSQHLSLRYLIKMKVFWGVGCFVVAVSLWKLTVLLMWKL